MQMELNGCGETSLATPDSVFVLGDDISLAWGDVDITDNEVTDYKKIIRAKDGPTQYPWASQQHLSFITREAFHVCRQNFPQRLEALCAVWCDDLGQTLYGSNMEGPFGESLLLEATAAKSIECIKVLTRIGGKHLIMKACSHEDFRGSTALHVAVVNGDMDIIDHLLGSLTEKTDREALLNVRLKGGLYKNRINSCELALPLALWSGRGDIYDALLDYGADLGASGENNGDNIMHSLVRFSAKNAQIMSKMYHYVINSEKTKLWWCRKWGFSESWACTSRRVAKDVKHFLLRTKNKEGYVPLTLAARLELNDLLRDIIKTNDVYRYQISGFGRADYFYYDMSDIDTNNTGPDMMSAMELLSLSYKDKSVECFSFQPMKQLMQLKWAAYCPVFFGLGLLHLVCMIILTLSVAFRPIKLASPRTEMNQTTSLPESAVPQELVVLWAAEVFVILVAIVYLGLEIFEVFRNVHAVIQLRKSSSKKSDRVWVRRVRPSYFSRVLIIYCLAVICWFGLRVAENPNEDILMVIAAIFGWHYILYFVRGFKDIGFFTVMVHRMLFRDIYYFAVVFCLVLLGFSTAMVAVLRNSPGGLPNEFTNFETAMFSMYRLAAGLIELDVFEKARVSILAQGLFVAFVAMVIVLLLNMLIAVMNDTYAEVAKIKTNLMLKVQACAALQIERRLPSCLHSFKGMKKVKINMPQYLQRAAQDTWILPVVEVKNKYLPAMTQAKSGQKKQKSGSKGQKGKGNTDAKKASSKVENGTHSTI